MDNLNYWTPPQVKVRVHFCKPSGIQSWIIYLLALCSFLTVPNVIHCVVEVNQTMLWLDGKGVQKARPQHFGQYDYTIPHLNDRIYKTITLPDQNEWVVWERYGEYAYSGYKVSWWSLFKCWMLPRHTHLSLCTSFAQYIATGEVSSDSSNIRRLINRLSEYGYQYHQA